MKSKRELKDEIEDLKNEVEELRDLITEKDIRINELSRDLKYTESEKYPKDEIKELTEDHRREKQKLYDTIEAQKVRMTEIDDLQKTQVEILKDKADINYSTGKSDGYNEAVKELLNGEDKRFMKVMEVLKDAKTVPKLPDVNIVKD